MEPAQFQGEEHTEQEPKKIILFVGIAVLVLILLAGTVFAFMKKSRQVEERGSVDSAVGEQNGIDTSDTAVVPQEEIIDLFPNDKDRDGLLDEEEALLGTTDYDYDSDGDGLSDADEIEIWNTSPTNPDSDGDGFQDGFEVVSGYNPAGAGTIE